MNSRSAPYDSSQLAQLGFSSCLFSMIRLSLVPAICCFRWTQSLFVETVPMDCLLELSQTSDSDCSLSSFILRSISNVYRMRPLQSYSQDLIYFSNFLKIELQTTRQERASLTSSFSPLISAREVLSLRVILSMSYQSFIFLRLRDSIQRSMACSYPLRADCSFQEICICSYELRELSQRLMEDQRWSLVAQSCASLGREWI